MANCHISQLADQCVTTQASQDLSTIPEGRVGQVCKEWLIREDGNLAYRLQNEEISQHYKENRFKNRVVREDIPIAKQLQQRELFEAQQVRSRSEQHHYKQTDHDEKMAQLIQKRLWIEEEQAKRAAEEADERFAQKLLQKDKARQLKKRVEREKQQVELLSAQMSAHYQLDSSEPIESYSTNSSFCAQPSFQRILTEDEQELDLSEFCMSPPPGLTPEELRLFLEEQDAEIARLLQRQELKRNKNPEKEKLAMIEAQDYELARMLQKMEKNRVRRIKEKLRAKQSQQEWRPQSTESMSTSLSRDDPLVNMDPNNFQRSSTPISPEASMALNEEHMYDIPENYLLNQKSAVNEADSITYEEPYQVFSQQGECRLLQKPFHNIAIDLDPTYQRRLHSSPTTVSQSQSNLLESCVDDEQDVCVTQNSRLARSTDSLTRVSRAQAGSTEVPHGQFGNSVSCTTSSHSSHSSCGSGRIADDHNQFSRPTSTTLHEQKEYAPPLPPRDMSLPTSRCKLESEPSDGLQVLPPPANYLPPHHPQHPNRCDSISLLQDSSSSSSLKRQSVYSTTSVPIKGHRRASSIEKQKNKEKHKSQDGCRTQ